MKPILVAYATREGHTRTIAERVTETLRGRGDAVEIVDATSPPEGFDASRYGGVILAASVDLGRHEREMVTFVKEHLAALERVPTVFLSASLSEAGVEDMTAPFGKRAQAAEDVKRLVESFCHETHLHPSRIWPVAGALTFSRYGALKGFVMRRIAKTEGVDDVAHDHDFTDWGGLERFVLTIAPELERGAA